MWQRSMSVWTARAWGTGTVGPAFPCVFCHSGAPSLNSWQTGFLSGLAHKIEGVLVFGVVLTIGPIASKGGLCPGRGAGRRVRFQQGEELGSGSPGRGNL